MLSQAWAVFACGAILTCAAAQIAQTDSAEPQPDAEHVAGNPGASERGAESGLPSKFREGMHVTELAGHFDAAVEGPIFVDESGHRLEGLENLNLQRIARTLREALDPSVLKWKVSGTITEYEGRNFILIERAVYSAPEQ
jgi:hypothetical protein